MQQQLEILMTGHARQQQAMLTRLGGIVQRRLQLQQQQSDKTAFTVIKEGVVCSAVARITLYRRSQCINVDVIATNR